MATFSHSKLSCYEQCPLKYKYQYLDKIKTDKGKNIEAFMGSIVHETLEKLYNDLRFEKIPELNELLEFYNKKWDELWEDDIVIVREDYSEENYKKMGEKYICEYYKTHKPFDESKTIALETEYIVPIDKENNYEMHVRIDRLAINKDIYEIHDYKTSNTLPDREYFDNERQLALYAYGIKYKFPDAKKIRLIWHYLAFGKEILSIRTDEELEELRNKTIKLIREIEKQDDFPSRESALCSWCEYKEICPRFKHIYEIKGNDETEFVNGKELVDKYSRLDFEIKEKQEELEKTKEQLKNYAQNNNIENVYGSEKRAYVKSYDSLQFPKKNDSNRQEFIEKIKDMGIWNQVMSVDSYELAKMINSGNIKNSEFENINSFIKKSKITRIYLKNK